MVKFGKFLLTVAVVAATLNLSIHVCVNATSDGTIPAIPEELLEILPDSE
ncbi:MAG: hypothetical protein AAF208_13150 [Cyanobacteria bacterium P01_A01_bin.45]